MKKIIATILILIIIIVVLLLTIPKSNDLDQIDVKDDINDIQENKSNQIIDPNKDSKDTDTKSDTLPINNNTVIDDPIKDPQIEPDDGELKPPGYEREVEENPFIIPPQDPVPNEQPPVIPPTIIEPDLLETENSVQGAENTILNFNEIYGSNIEFIGTILTNGFWETEVLVQGEIGKFYIQQESMEIIKIDINGVEYSKEEFLSMI
ncbi:hypothetical protein ACFL1H_06925 [Nanoarchaeota archaeon]